MGMGSECSLIDMQQFNTMFKHFSFLFSSFVAMHFTFNSRVYIFFLLLPSLRMPTLQRQSNSDEVIEREEATREWKEEEKKKKMKICNCIRSFRMHATRHWTSLMKNWRQSVHRHFFPLRLLWIHFEFFFLAFVNDISTAALWMRKKKKKKYNSMTKTTNERRMKNIIFQFSESRVFCFVACVECGSCRSAMVLHSIELWR